jgi:hypothetical protein
MKRGVPQYSSRGAREKTILGSFGKNMFSHSLNPDRKYSDLRRDNVSPRSSCKLTQINAAATINACYHPLSCSISSAIWNAAPAGTVARDNWFAPAMNALARGGVKERAMQSLRRLALAAGATGVVWASPAAADDWATPITAVQKSLADAGVKLGFGVTGFGQGLAAGDGVYGIPFGGKADVILGLDGGRLGLWSGFGVSAHLEQEFGQNANMQCRQNETARIGRRLGDRSPQLLDSGEAALESAGHF